MGKRQGLCVGQAQCALSLQRGPAVAHAGHEFYHRGQILSDFRLPDCHCGQRLAGHPAGHPDRALLIPCRHRKNRDHRAPRNRKGGPGGLCRLQADSILFRTTRPTAIRSFAIFTPTTWPRGSLPCCVPTTVWRWAAPFSPTLCSATARPGKPWARKSFLSPSRAMRGRSIPSTLRAP